MRPPTETEHRRDLRMPALGAAAWTGALLARGGTLPLVGAGLAGALLVVLAARRHRRVAGRRRARSAAAVTLAGAVLVLVAVGCVTLVRSAQLSSGPVATLTRDGASVRVEGTVTTDPRLLEGRYGRQVLARLEVRRVEARTGAWRTAAPVLVLSDDQAWRAARLGSEVSAEGRLLPAEDGDVAALLRSGHGPTVTADPDLWWRGADAVRSSLRRSVAGRPAEQRALVPALVDGDDAGVDPGLAEDFRTTGLTHLLAVSGTNLTLVVGFALVLARGLRVRGRWLHLVGACGIVGFVLLARTEPSVLRAAVMGSVGLVALGAGGRERGSRALGVAVVVLLLVDPGLAVAPGFALSVLATAGILLLAPGWRDALARWLPRAVAEAVAVPAAAQLACTPVVAALSGQVSLVAVVANLLVAPVVGPATVLGLAGGLLGLVWVPLGAACGTLAGWCVAWVVAVAHRGAALPTAAVAWGSGPLAVAALVVLTGVVVVVAPRLLRRRSTGLAGAALGVVVVVVRLPTPGWPPHGWVMVACDVGQGDALVLAAAPHTAVVVDAGPEPTAVDRCLDRLGVTSVPLLVLTHFHADHVGGIDGVVGGRSVRTVLTTRLQDPPGGVAQVAAAATAAGATVTTAAAGETRTVGAVTLQTLWPPADSPTAGPGDGSTANEASVVLLVQVQGIRLLLPGDIEPEGQERLATALPGLAVDVLKVPHHGSRYQDLDFLRSLGARVDLVSVGADNDYGHPAAETLAPLEATGARVLRTDEDGDLAVVVHQGRLSTATRVGGL